MLTEKQIRAFKPREKDYVVSDGRSARGEGVLILKVRPNGTKEFYFQRHVDGKKKLAKVGVWPSMSLVEARDSRREQHGKVAAGGTFQNLMDAYVNKLDGESAASVDDVRWSLKHYVSEAFPYLVARPASSIGPGDIRDIIARMIEAGITTYCNRVRSQLHAAFQMGLEQEFNPRSYHQDDVKFGLQSNPVASVPVQDDWERPGERALTVEELATLWQLLPEKLSLTTAVLLQFLIASGGQRPEQLLAVERQQYYKDHLLIRNKKGKDGEKSAHAVPYNKLMRQCLQTMAEISANSAYPFEGKVVGQSLHANSLSRAVTKLYGRHAEKFEGPFTLRDIRRTCKTLMGVVGLSKELRDRIQGHAFSDVSSKHYDRYDYFKEKQRGLARWSTWLEKNAIKSPWTQL
ncbi:MAG: integrase family protein [Pseudomonas qingdaonensis]|uniref:tyrosine-type recombinase/integrase n=1 Tax=Pseudomonas qingdaonensis TaxID=2056231 RepID=UPI0033148C93